MTRKIALAAVLLMLFASCSSDNDEGPQTRVVRVDYLHDEFPTAIFEYFPRDVTVRQGDTVSFQQDWTGEPHTVTMGVMVDKLMKVASPLIKRFRNGEEVSDKEYTEVVDNSPEGKALPFFFGDPEGIAQNAAQPCYLETGTPPENPDQACPKTKQPDFNGRQNYYNSGFIPYEGSGKNEFKVKFADDAKTGKYFYYCNLHGPAMSGLVTLKSKGSSIPSQADVNKQAVRLIEQTTKPLKKQVDTFKSKGKLKLGGKTVSGNLSGIYTEEVVFGGINAFLPETIEAKVGEKVTWNFSGEHSVSFDVPPYFPIFLVKEDGKVDFNADLEDPAGGSPALPEEPEGPPDENSEPPAPTIIDGGTWDGSGYFSSGLFGHNDGSSYSLRISKPGVYQYACLIHPAMVGRISVK